MCNTRVYGPVRIPKKLLRRLFDVNPEYGIMLQFEKFGIRTFFKKMVDRKLKNLDETSKRGFCMNYKPPLLLSAESFELCKKCLR